MRDGNKTKEQLIDEPVELRQRIAGLEASEAERKRTEELLQERTHKLRKRIKELNCFYGICSLAARQGISSEQIFQGIVDLIPRAWQYPEIARARIILEDQEFRTENFMEAHWKQTSDIIVHGDRVGDLEVCYLEERQERDEGPFLKEERWLLDAVARRLGRIIERKRAEEALRESEEKYRVLVENANEAVIVAQDGMLKFVNPEAVELTGYSRDELTSRPFVELVHPDDREMVVERHLKRLKGEELPHIYPFRIIDKDGNIKWVEISAVLITWDGRPATLNFLSDITQRKRAEKELKETNAFLRSILESSSSVSIISTDLERNILYWNVGAENIFGYKAEEVVGSRKIGMLYDDEEEVKKKIEAVRSTIFNDRKEVNCKIREVTKDGRKLWINLSLTPRLDENGQVIGILGIGEDITERKRAEEELIHLYKAVNMSTDGIVVSDLEMKIIDINEAILRMYGTDDKKDVIGRNSLDIIVPEDREKAIARMEEVLEKGYIKTEEYHIITKAGGRIPVEMSATLMKDADGKPVGFVAVSRDITERKRAEQALRESEERYRDLFENANDLIQSVAPDGRFIYVNRAWRETLGYSEEEIADLSLFDIIHPDSQAHCAQVFQRVVSGEKIDKVEATFVSKDGKEIIVEGSANCKFVDGKPVATRGIFRDITERKQTENALREYQKAVESSDDMVAAVDRQYVYLFVNEAFLRYNRLNRDQVVGHTAAEVLGEEVFELTVKPNVDRCLQGESIQYEMVRRYPEIGERRMQVSYYPLKDDGDDAAGVVAIIRDTTEKRKMEEELLKAQKLESIGTLAGGIAHDFNNILTGILGNISLARIYTDPGKISERLAEAEKASMQAKDLTQQLLTFSRGGAPIRKTASIAGLLKDSAIFALRGSNVRCGFSMPDDLWPVEVDEGQMNQVINNLIINADQAMPEGGVIEVRAENVTVGAEDALPLEEGEYVKISIADQGIGISEEHLQKIFDPYFTTKQKGNGLGLATAYSIIKNHDGYITAESQVGVGTTFHIYLSASPEKVVMKEKKEEEEKPIMGEGRILVMDDEELVRELICDMLTNIGYKVTTATDGTKAIELYRGARESDHPFDAVIVDLTVPGDMGGEATIQRLMEIDPEVKAIVSSGYSNDPVMADFRKYGFSGVMAKPYKTKELSEVLHRVMSDG